MWNGPFDLGVSITETVDDDKETQIILLFHIKPAAEPDQSDGFRWK